MTSVGVVTFAASSSSQRSSSRQSVRIGSALNAAATYASIAFCEIEPGVMKSLAARSRVFTSRAGAAGHGSDGRR